MSQLTYRNVFEAISDNPQEAAVLEFRANLMMVLRSYFEGQGWNQADISSQLGIPQPRVSELMKGKIHLFSSDKLVGYLSKLGLRIKPIYKAGKVDAVTELRGPNE